jgi:hypothetical protein
MGGAMKNRKLVISVIASIVVICVCCCITPKILPTKTDTSKTELNSLIPTIIDNSQISPEHTVSSTFTPSITVTSSITYTPTISYTPSITYTPSKTYTSTKTFTSTKTYTPTKNPFSYEGSGDSVVDITKPKPDDPALLKIEYTGYSNFIIWSYNSDGEKIDLLVNTIGNFKGTIPLDFMDGENTTRLEIKSSGHWKIDVLPLSECATLTVPGKYSGQGSDVIGLLGKDPDLLKVDASKAKHNFVIWGFSGNRDLLVNEIAPYTGTVVLDRDTDILAIMATGDWTIEITAR